MKSASKGPGGAKAGTSASGGNAGPAKQVQKVKAIGGDQGTNSADVSIKIIFFESYNDEFSLSKISNVFFHEI